MKVQKRINYYHNRHRSDGALMDKREKRPDNETGDLLLSNKEVLKNFNFQNINANNNFYNSSVNFNKFNSMNKYKNELNLTEENMKNTSYQYQNNSFYNELTNDEYYLNDEYNTTSDNLIKNISFLCKALSRKENKKQNLEKKNQREKSYYNYEKIEKENNILISENKKLEQEIKMLNNSMSRDPTQNEIEKLCNINRKIMKENEFYGSMINKIKINKSNEKVMNNSMKYKTDFLVQNMISSMKDLIYLLDNDKIKDSYMNTNMTLDNKSCGYIPTENFDNFTQSSFTQENQLKAQ